MAVLSGSEFESVEQFGEAISNRDAHHVSIADSLGKRYTVDELRDLEKSLEIEAEVQLTEDDGKGPGKSHALARKIVELCGPDRSGLLGRHVLDVDHKRIRPWVSYFEFPEDWGPEVGSLSGFLQKWNRKNDELQLDLGATAYYQERPFVRPPSRASRLESARVNTERNKISLVFGSGRIESVPGSSGSSQLESIFYNRVPSRVVIYPNQRLIEILVTKPAPANVNLARHPRPSMPDRLYQLVNQVYSSLREYTFETPPRSFDGNLPLRQLEEDEDAEDLGWHVQPARGGEFDLSNTRELVPLKEILDRFTNHFERKCSEFGKESPLPDIGLYHIFRALKSTSHTYSMAVSAQLAPGTANVIVTAFLGAPDHNRYNPLFHLRKEHSRAGRYVFSEMRRVIREALNRQPVDQYDIEEIICNMDA